MYSESDLDAAVRSREISADMADRLRSFVARSRRAPASEEEYVRLLGSFNDVFVTSALLLVLGGFWTLGAALMNPPVIGFVLVALLAWPAAEYFTLRRKAALPSFVLMLAFVTGVAGAVFSALIAPLLPIARAGGTIHFGAPDPSLFIGCWLACAGAALAHWVRFKVPATMALLGGALFLLAGAVIRMTALGIVFAGLPPSAPFLPAGLLLFAWAMWWDMSDVYRQTRRADVAFWLHLLAALMIVHSTFALLGVGPSAASGTGAAALALLVYALFCLVALAIDRRALMVSSLIYVLAAFSSVVFGSAASSAGMTLGAILVGALLLGLAIGWTGLRRRLLDRLPAALRAQLPRPDLAVAGPRPVR